MSRAVRVHPVYQSRFLWRVYIALAVVLALAGVTMVAVFIWNMPFSETLDSYAMLRALAMAAAVGVTVALITGLWLAQSVRAALDDITHVAQALTCGDFTARVRRLRDDEFGLLGLTLNLLGEELTDRVATLSQERAQLQAMLAGMVEGIVAIDDDDHILFSNRAADKLLKTDVSGAKGKRLGEVFGLGVILPMIIEARKGFERVQREVNLGDGSSLATLDITAARFCGDQDSGVVVVLHDVTDLRRLERVRRDFVANVSHELKTPLTSVKGYLETLQSGAKDDPAVLTRFLGKIENNVVRLVALVQDILALGSIETQDGKLQSERVDWLPVIRQVLTHHEHEVQRKKISLDATKLESVYVYGDREAMTQIADNLVSNAIKYTPEGGSVRLTLKRGPQGAAFEVKDTGFGIPQDQIPRIFERFYRVDKARSRELGGTGLGLSIVKHLVSAMNGKVSVESEVGKGSAFAVTLSEAD